MHSLHYAENDTEDIMDGFTETELILFKRQSLLAFFLPHIMMAFPQTNGKRWSPCTCGQEY